MNCEKCGSDHVLTVDTRSNKLTEFQDVGHIYRRKECSNCGERFTTIEVRMKDFRKSEVNNFIDSLIVTLGKMKS